MAAGKPVVVEGLVCAEPTVMAWEDGERERWWARAAALEHGREQDDWAAAVAGADHLSDLTPEQQSWLLVRGPESSARALLGKSLVLLRHRQQADVDRVAAARFELDAWPLVLRDAGSNADRLGFLVLPFRGPEIAALVAGWLRHLGSARLWARLWLERHARSAASALVPAAVGRPGRARQQAEDALRHLVATGHEATVVEAAEGYGTGVLAALTALREEGVARPARKAKAKAWTLPEIRLVTGEGMPQEDTGRLVEALTWSRLEAAPEPAPGDPAPDTGDVPVGVESAEAPQPFVHHAEPEAEKLIADCDRGSLAAFGRALLDAWLADGMQAADAWVLLAQAHVGDDTTMDVLAPLVRSWPPNSRYARAIDGLAVLATVGTDVALRHLLAIEENMSGGPTNDRATAYLTQAAARRGLSVTQLADRLAVTHGLDSGVTFDYGPRAFTVVADEHLTAFAVDESGKRLPRPPKPGPKDTNLEAYQQVLQYKKDLRATAAAHTARLQRDMLARRLRPARDVREVLLPHPILGPLARRLLWGEHDTAGRLVRALRVAEDGSFADIDDASATTDGMLGIVHPADLGGDLKRWARIVADYELLPPFPQLGRPVVVLSGAQRAATSLPGLRPVPTDRVVALLDRAGWQGNGLSQRLHTQLAHALPGGLALVIEIAPGVPTYSMNNPDQQQIAEIWADDAWSNHLRLARRIPLGACDPAALSELLVALHQAP
ncbi:DUF4132 domain-containing protein [Dactylosporangium sp. CA-152071]|uniref:DUF4132 domain-containing protein n=1 Tax=Dactylosporangium sp. CA-152071 TaxID=3239933 RepID=UPI003D92FDBB